MKLWLVVRRSDRRHEEYTSFVVRAKDEDQARQLCSNKALSDGAYAAYKPDFWLNEETSSCMEVPIDGEPEIILADYLES